MIGTVIVDQGKVVRPSQLIASVGQAWATGMRQATVTVLVAGASLCLQLTGCDTLIADRMTVRWTSDAPRDRASTMELMAVAHEAFSQCGMRDADLTRDTDTWLWKNPKGPPGLHVMVTPSGSDIRVTLAQDLFGPIGPTETYRCVRNQLRETLVRRYGKAEIRFE
jgi:hypothetical protein